MNSYNSRTGLSVLSYVLITIATTILLLEMYGAEIIKYQLSHSTLFSYLNALTYSGFGQWDGLLPLTTFLISLTGGLCCALFSGLFIKAFEGVTDVLQRLTSRNHHTLSVK
ncbi:hypothetical protein NTH58_003971 [Enterobacter oligotrophicus]|nr:hypothetical protein [Enterobacter oligotrophicus]